MPSERPDYSADQLDALRQCRKVISDPPKRAMKLERGTWRNDMRLTSVEGTEEFRVFIRKNDKFPENFSIGLVYLAKDGSGELHLLRCNGSHGPYNAAFDPDHPHYAPHVHMTTEETIASGNRPESNAQVCQEYASIEEALQYFLRTANIADAMQHFPDFAQAAFRFEPEEPNL